MFRILILNTALILLTAAQSVPQPPTDSSDFSFEIPVFNLTESQEEPNYKYLNPATLTDKAYAVSILARVNWITAQQICGYYGMTLASINSKLEADRLQIHLNGNIGAINPEGFWIGGSDLGTRFQWTWLTNGHPFIYTNWARGQPDNRGENERCVSLHQGGVWHDFDCDSQKFFICENRCVRDGNRVNQLAIF